MNGETDLTLEVHGLAESRKDMRVAAMDMHVDEARFFVGRYYSVQKQRIAAQNIVRSLVEDGRPNSLAKWAVASQQRIEDDIKLALGSFATHHPVGDWLLGVHGIGPVLAAGLLAHIDIRKAPAAGHIWNFAGLNPAVKWEKGQKRPWNAELKTLCWKIGESFVKSSGSDKSFYGPLYRARKELEVEKNARGDFAEQAAHALETRKVKDAKLKTTYEAGQLPPIHLDMRARRFAVKIFLSHLHAVWYWIASPTLGEFSAYHHAPVPYVLAHMQHVHYISVPNPPWSASEAPDYDIPWVK